MNNPKNPAHTGERISDLATLVTQLAAQLTSFQDDSEEWHSRLEQRMASIEALSKLQSAGCTTRFPQSTDAADPVSVARRNDQDSTSSEDPSIPLPRLDPRSSVHSGLANGRNVGFAGDILPPLANHRLSWSSSPSLHSTPSPIHDPDLHTFVPSNTLPPAPLVPGNGGAARMRKRKRRSQRLAEASVKSSDKEEDIDEVEARTSSENFIERPLKIPRFMTPLTEEDAKLQVRQADDICKTFFHEQGGNPKHALLLYESAGHQGYVPGMVRAAVLLARGAVSLGPRTTKIRRNIKSALFWLNKALEQDPDFTEAINLRGDLWLESKGKKSIAYKNALALYTRSAGLGDAEGMFLRGRLFHSKMQEATTLAQKRKYCKNALQELTRAVQNGSGTAASLLASLFANEEEDPVIAALTKQEEGGDNPVKKSTELYLLSMQRGSPQGTNDVATCYEVGYGDVVCSFDLARQHYERAFKLGHRGAAANLGLLFEHGAEGKFPDRVDEDEAFKWFNIGHNVGCPVATYHLGRVFYTGSVADRNPHLAERLIVAAINFAKDSGQDLDLIPRAEDALFKMYAMKVLMNASGADQARKQIFSRLGKTGGNGRLEKLRRDFAIIVCANVGSGNQGPSDFLRLTSARGHAQEVLGQGNYEAVLGRAKKFLKSIQVRRRQNAEVSEEVSLLMHIIGEQGIVDLELE